MKRLILPVFILQTALIFAVDNGFENGKYCSDNFKSFSQCFKRDSILSLHAQKGFIPALIYNLKRQVTFPARMNDHQWMMLMGFCGITAGLIHYDADIDKVFKPVKENSLLIEQVSPHITDLGDVYGYLFLAGFAGYSVAFHNYRAFRVSLLATQAAVSSGIWTRIGKTLSGRMRPGQLYGDFEYTHDHWFGPFGQFKKKNNERRGIGAFDAFPSGHTGAAFAIATVFAREYSDYKAIPFVSYTLAGIVGITRLIEHEHWMSDVIVGGTIGYLCGRQVVENERRLFGENTFSQKKSKPKTCWSFFVDDHVKGVKWNLTF